MGPDAEGVIGMIGNAIEAEGLTRRFGRKLSVAGLSFRVPHGSLFALLGPNGAGKTTTIKLLMNLLAPTRGSSRVLGTDSTRLGPSELAQIGYVSENQRLPGWMTLAEPVADLEARFRRVEVITGDEAPLPAALPAGWLQAEKAGRTVRFVDSRYGPASGEAIAAVFPNCAVTLFPMSLREVFLTLARNQRSAGGS